MTSMGSVGGVSPEAMARIQALRELAQAQRAAKAAQGRPVQAAQPEAHSQPAYGAHARPQSAEPEAPAPAKRIPLPYADIQATARRAGFIGLTEAAIQRAYVMGESLMVDTRI